MNSFTGIFHHRPKPSMHPHVLTQAPPHQILKAPLPMEEAQPLHVLSICGKPWHGQITTGRYETLKLQTLLFLWEVAVVGVQGDGRDVTLWMTEGGRLPKLNMCKQRGEGKSEFWSFCDNFQNNWMCTYECALECWLVNIFLFKQNFFQNFLEAY